MKLALITILSVFLCGCAFLKSKTTRTYSVMPGGAITNVCETTVATVYTLFDSKSSLTKFRNQSSQSGYGSNTFAPGTYLTGLTLESTSTNLNEIIGIVAKGVAQGVVQGIK